MNASVRRIFAVAGRELRAASASPLMWVFLTAFLLLSGFCTFIAGNLLGSGQADLQPFFDWQGWLLLVFVPALGMPLWAEELRAGTFEMLLSFPGRIWELALGKYLAGLAMLAAGLLLTLPTPLSVLYLGKPDLGSVFCGYLGAFLLGAVYLAASCLCSALSRSQTASFLLSLILSATLMLMGWPVALDTLSGWGAPEWALSTCGLLGAVPHYQAFVRGIVDFGDLVYFVGFSFLFVFLAAETLELASAGASRGILRRGMMSDPATRKLSVSLFSSALLAFAVVLAALATTLDLRLRADLTSDQAFSLSPEAAKIAASLDGNVRIRYYFNPSRMMPDDLRSYGARVEWLLEELAASSKGKISLVKLRPELDSDDEEAALMDGQKPAPTSSGERLFLGLAVSRGGRLYSIPFLSPQSERLLESDICRALLNISRNERPKVGVMSALPVLGQSLQEGGFAPASAKQLARPWQSFKELMDDFDLISVPLDPQAIPDYLSCLVILQPCGITDHAQYLIDQYLLRGGRLVVFVDPRCLYSIQKANIQHDSSFADKVESDLPKLLPAWGVTYNKSLMLADMNFAYRMNSPDKMIVNPMVMNVTREGLNMDSPLTGSLSALSFCFSGVLQTAPVGGLRKESLVFSTQKSQVISALLGSRVELVLRNFTPSGEKHDLAVKLSGTFKSAFPNGFPGESGGLQSSKSEGQIAIFADADMLFNDVAVRQVEDSMSQRTIVRVNDNISLFQNILEAFCGSEKLSTIRSRVPMRRPLVMIDKLKADAELAFRNRTLELESSYKDITGKLTRLQAMKPKGEQATASYSEEQRVQLGELSAKLEEVKSSIKIMRRSLRADLEQLELKFKLLNVVAVPAAVALFGLCWLLWPRRRGGSK